MSNIKHTPGPWNVDLDGPFTLGGDIVSIEALTPDGMISREVCTCMLDTEAHPDGAEDLEDAANARLIAAAPELLMAVNNLLDLLEGNSGSGANFWEQDWRYNQAIGAVQKANGES